MPKCVYPKYSNLKLNPWNKGLTKVDPRVAKCGQSGKMVVCVETGKTFKTLKDAAASVGGKHGCVLGKYIQSSTKYKNLTWEFCD